MFQARLIRHLEMNMSFAGVSGISGHSKRLASLHLLSLLYADRPFLKMSEYTVLPLMIDNDIVTGSLLLVHGSDGNIILHIVDDLQDDAIRRGGHILPKSKEAFITRRIARIAGAIFQDQEIVSVPLGFISVVINN